MNKRKIMPYPLYNSDNPLISRYDDSLDIFREKQFWIWNQDKHNQDFLTQRIERNDMLRTILKEMWANYRLDKSQIKKVQILEKIEENQVYLSSYYDLAGNY